MDLENTNAAIETKKKEQDSLRGMLTENVQRATRMKGDYEDAVKSGAAEVKLDSMDEALFRIDRERTRIEIRLTQTGVEIEELTALRRQAYAEKCRSDFVETATLAGAQAQEIEALLDRLMEIVKPHKNTLERLNRLASECGVQSQLRSVHLERRIEAKFAGHSLHKLYKEPYPVILRGSIDPLLRQLGGKPETGQETETVLPEMDETTAAAN